MLWWCTYHVVYDGLGLGLRSSVIGDVESSCLFEAGFAAGSERIRGTVVG